MNVSFCYRGHAHVTCIVIIISLSNISCFYKFDAPNVKNETVFFVNRNANSIRLVNFKHDNESEPSKYGSNIRGEIREVLCPGRSWYLREEASTLKIVETGKDLPMSPSLDRQHFPEWSINDTSSFLQTTPTTQSDKLFSFLPLLFNFGSLRMDTCQIDMTINSKFGFYGNSIKHLIFSGREHKLPKVELEFSSMSTATIGTVTIQRSTLFEIVINQNIKHLIIKDCRVESIAQIMGSFAPDTLTLDNIWFNPEIGIFDITQIGSINKDKRTVLRLKDVAINNLKLDYKKFFLIPFSEFYEKIYTSNRNTLDFIFRSIMENQKVALNDKGYELAVVDLSKYQDSKKSAGWLLISLKEWWNNYGEDRDKVVISSLELFFFCSLINMMLRRKLKVVYPISTVEAKFDLNKLENRKLKKALTWIFINFLYTVYIFSPFNWDIEKLQLNKFRIAMWVVCQRIFGFISLGYLTNLIFSN